MGRDDGHLATWIAWLMGAALVSAVVLVALHFSEARQFVTLLRHVRGEWLALALLLQAATYGVQGEIWRVVDRASSRCIGVGAAWIISLAKLFLDQTLPSAGVASSLAATDALIRRGMSRPAALAAVWLNIISYNAAYVVALTAALALSALSGHADWFVIGTAALFIVFCIVMSGGVLALAGRHRVPLPRRLLQWPAIRRATEFVGEADPALTRSPRLLIETTALQLVIVALDTATLVVLIYSIGARAPLAGVFVSFMVSSLFRTMGFVPGGLGTFEASSVITLRSAGLHLAAALSVTLLFRGLSFWLPMIPGLMASRRVIVRDHAAATDGQSMTTSDRTRAHP